VSDSRLNPRWSIANARGTLAGFTRPGAYTLALVDWDQPDQVPPQVNIYNLSPLGSNLLCIMNIPLVMLEYERFENLAGQLSQSS